MERISNRPTHVDRDVVKEALRGLPLDFIRALRIEGHRDEVISTLLRPLPHTDDFRFTWRGSGANQCAILCEKLPWDTQFFGYGVARLSAVVALGQNMDDGDIVAALRALKGMLLEAGVRYVFTSVDTRDLQVIRALCTAGFVVIENRVSYYRHLCDYDYKERFEVRPAEQGDIDSLSETAVSMVNPYDRFHADPFITKADADRMMREWVVASLQRGFADITMVPAVPRPTAFCTVKYHRDMWSTWGLKLSQPVFSAVAPEYRGWYLRLISEISFHLKAVGAECVYMTTQATNRAVLRTWEKLGYQFGKGELVFRALLAP